MYHSAPLLLLFFSSSILLLAASLRLLFILPPHRSKPRKRYRKDASAVSVLVVLGSGGHTAEMLAMLGKVDVRSFGRRVYVVTSGDGFSAERARVFEEGLRRGGEGAAISGGGAAEQGRGRGGGRTETEVDRKERTGSEVAGYDICTIPRARRIHQSLFTTPVTAIYTLIAIFKLLLSMERPPNLIITNGPGTGVIVVLASIVLRFFDIRGANSRSDMRTVYVESWARVNELSLSGRLLSRVVDRFVVQWERLEGRAGGRAEYHGVLV